MKERATRLWGWQQRHQIWSSVILIVVLVCMGTALFWTVNLVRFGLPPPTGHECGSIRHSEDGDQTVRGDATLQSLACFWRAHQTCQAATISQEYAGADGGYIDTLTIEHRLFGCAIYGQEEHFINLETSNTTFLCTQLNKKGDTLQVSTCDGIAPFALVPRDVFDESYFCGAVGFISPDGTTPQEIEVCFFAAYQHCLADYMGYTTLRGGAQMAQGFYIDNHCGIAYQRGSYIAYQRGSYAASCASLEMNADGLHFLQCGMDGDLFVPSAPR